MKHNKQRWYPNKN